MATKMLTMIMVSCVLFIWVLAALMSGAWLFMIGLPFIIALAGVAFCAIDYGDVKKDG